MAAATAAFIVIFATLVFYKHAHFGTRAFDLAIFDQGLWLLSNGETPFVTVRGLHLFADHSSFLMVLLVPLYWIWADVRMLLILTVLAMAAGGPLVYAAARAERIPPAPAAALGVGYLMLPAVQWQVWDVFHPETLVIPVLIAAYLMALWGRPGWAFVALAVVLLAKEDAPLVVLPLAIYLGIRFRHRRLAVAGGTAAIAAAVLNFGLLLPHWSPTGELIYTGRYAEFGDSLGAILWGLVTSPGEVVAGSLAGERPLYIIGLLLPFVVCLAAPEVLAVALPTLLANLLSAHDYQANLRYHYTAYIIAVVAIAGVVGMRRMITWWESRALRWRSAVIALTLGAVLIGSLVAGPWGIGKSNPWSGRAARTDLTGEALAMIPEAAAVAAGSSVVPHLAHRTSVYVFPNPVVPLNWSAGEADPPPVDDFDWVVIHSDVREKDREYLSHLDRLTGSGDFAIVLHNAELTVWQRITPRRPVVSRGGL